MKKLYITTCFLIIFMFSLSSQNSQDSVLNEIEKNNTSLIALKKMINAEKIGNKTNIFLNNPEFEFGYLWGAPSDLGNRTDISLTQSFDFPTAYFHRKKIAALKNQQSETEYKIERIKIKNKVMIICSDLIFHNLLITEYSKRLSHAKSIANSYKLRFDAGETSVLEYNKAQLNYITISNELEKYKLEKELLTAELIKLNGGKKIGFNDSIYRSYILPEDFDEWFLEIETKNPILNQTDIAIEIGKKEQQLTKSESLPKFHAGYMSEKVTDEQFNGITMGISIPLWENKNKIKYAKAKTIAFESYRENQKIFLYNELKSLYNKAVSLKKLENSYQESMSEFNNTDLLKKALDAGEIDLIDYMLELSIYYDSYEKLLNTKNELNKTLIQLFKYNQR